MLYASLFSTTYVVEPSLFIFERSKRAPCVPFYFYKSVNKGQLSSYCNMRQPSLFIGGLRKLFLL